MKASYESDLKYNLTGQQASKDNLINIDFLGWNVYMSYNNLFIDLDAVWVTNSGDYPKLYWEK